MSSFYSPAKLQTNTNAKDQVFLNIFRSHARREKLILHSLTVTQVARAHKKKKKSKQIKVQSRVTNNHVHYSAVSVV